MDNIVTTQQKLIKFLIHNYQGMSFASAQKMIRTGNVKVNNKRTRSNVLLNIGDKISVHEYSKSTPKVPIVYEDDNIIIVNKPSGIECATRDKSTPNTYSLEELFADKNAIVVHRLDRLTEGLVILAKSKDIARKFENYFRNKYITKQYLACTQGIPSQSGVLHAFLKKNSKEKHVEISPTPINDDYKEIITEIALVSHNNQFAILNIILHTGKTHQIRAHLAYLGTPIVGDTKYGNKINNFKGNGYMLTAYKLSFNIPDDELCLNNLSLEITPSWSVEDITQQPQNKA